MKYTDFVNSSYTPTPSDLICTFIFESEEFTSNQAAGAIAAESSIGTWTNITTKKPYVKDLSAKVFSIKNNTAKIAYPIELFETNNMPNILSSVAGNVFGLKALLNLRLDDIELPPQILKNFKGPKYGINGIRKLLNIPNRPLIGTIIKPKLGLNTKDHSQVAYQAWIGGCDIVKDDENLSSQNFNPFEERITQTIEKKNQAESETGEKKVYMANITSETQTMIKRAQSVQDQGGKYVMVDILTCGWAALQTLIDQNFNLVIHAHRAGHAAFTKNPKHGISMKVIAKISRLLGTDQLHVGTVVGKMSETKKEVLDNINALKNPMQHIKQTMPVASGGLHPRLVPSLIQTFGNDVIIQAGGGIHGHPNGTISGAKAMRQAVDAAINNQPLEEHAKTNKELNMALNLWKN